MNIRKILVPSDFSDYSVTAFEWAQEFAAKWDAQILVLHVFSATCSPGSKMDQQDSFATKLRETNCLAIVDTRQQKVAVWLADTRRIIIGRQKAASQ